MDCYVIGRKRVIGESEWSEAPDIHSLVVLRVTAASHGNALGVGLADFTTEELGRSIGLRCGPTSWHLETWNAAKYRSPMPPTGGLEAAGSARG